MDINRDNYEEFFLLYADNELSPTKKKEVELFVKLHHDLQEEFNMIQLTIIIPDENVRLATRSFLMKNEDLSFINNNNYEEVFVLYHDNELTNSQKKETEEFLKACPGLSTEFQVIGKAKLSSDQSIVFNNKKQLYRKTHTAKILPVFMWRPIAAAVFIGVCLWISLSNLHQEEGVRAIVSEGKGIPFLQPPTPIENSETAAAPGNEASADKAKSSIVPKGNEFTYARESKNKTGKVEEQKGMATTGAGKKVLPAKNAIPFKKPAPETLAATDPVQEITNDIVRTPALTAGVRDEYADKKAQTPEPMSEAQSSSYLQAENSDENYIFYNVKADEFNKTKVGGFVKKIIRIVERNNPVSRLLAGEGGQIASK